MSDQQAKDSQGHVDAQPQTKNQERRSQVRRESVLGQIQDATYAVLRKYERESV